MLRSVKSVRKECGVTLRNKGSVGTGRMLGCLADLKRHFGSHTKEAFVLRTDAPCVGRLVGSCEDGSGLGGCLTTKANIMSRQNARFV